MGPGAHRGPLDALDIGILRTMGVDPYGRPPQGPDALKPGTIARALGVTPETVRERVQRMEASGLIAGYQAFVNLGHLGLRGQSFLFRLPDEDRRRAVVPALEPVEGLLGVHAFLGSDVCLDLSYRSDADLARRLQLLGTLTGDAAPVGFYALDMPPVQRPLTNLDWRIVRALRGRGRRSLTEVAEEVGVGYRTVKRHYDLLCEEGSLYVVPTLDPSKGQGALPFWLLLYLRPDAPKDAVRTATGAFADRRLMGFVPAHPRFGHAALLLVASTPAEMERLRQEAGALPGVARASAMVPVGLHDTSGWVDDLIEARVRETAAAREAEA